MLRIIKKLRNLDFGPAHSEGLGHLRDTACVLGLPQRIEDGAFLIAYHDD